MISMTDQELMWYGLNPPGRDDKEGWHALLSAGGIRGLYFKNEYGQESRWADTYGFKRVALYLDVYEFLRPIMRVYNKNGRPEPRHSTRLDLFVDLFNNGQIESVAAKIDYTSFCGKLETNTTYHVKTKHFGKTQVDKEIFDKLNQLWSERVRGSFAGLPNKTWFMVRGGTILMQKIDAKHAYNSAMCQVVDIDAGTPVLEAKISFSLDKPRYERIIDEL